MSISISPEERYYDSKKMVFDLPPGVTFVFGSNLKGIHGAGAAKTALRNFGARLGIAQGKQGRSYGIATCAVPGDPLSFEEIRVNVEKFRTYHDKNENAYFYVTRVGCGYAGYSDAEIAPLFKGLERCYFPDIWEPYLKQQGTENVSQ